MQRCPHSCKIAYVDGHRVDSGPAAEFGRKVHKYIEDSIKEPVAPTMEPKAAELVLEAMRYVDPGDRAEVEFERPVRGVVFRGQVDLVKPDQLLDWKTGKVQDSIEDDIQAVLYSYIFQRPISFVYLRHGVVLSRGVATDRDLDLYVWPYVEAYMAGEFPVNTTACYAGWRGCEYLTVCDKADPFGAAFAEEEFKPWRPKTKLRVIC